MVLFKSDAKPAPAATDDEAPLFTEIREQLARALAKSCPAWLQSRREDLIQGAVLKLMEKRARGEGNLEWGSSYLWKVAYSVLIDEIRAQKRRAEQFLETDSEQVDHAPAHAPHADPERAMDSGRIGSAIRDCLNHLTETRRLATTLYLQGHRVPELAQLLGWTLKKSENLVLRGMSQLRECLTAKGLKP